MPPTMLSSTLFKLLLPTEHTKRVEHAHLRGRHISMPSSGHGRTLTSAPAAPAPPAADRPPAEEGATGPPGSTAGVALPSAAAVVAAAAPCGGAVCGRAPPEAEAGAESEVSADCWVPVSALCRCRCRCSSCCVSASCLRATASARAALPDKVVARLLRVVASGSDTWCVHGACMVRACMVRACMVRSAPEEAPVGAGTRKRARARVPSVAAAGQLSSRLSRKRARGRSCAQRRRRPCEGVGLR